MKLQLQVVQNHYKASVDEYRRKKPSLQVGDKLWLLQRNIKANWPWNKLGYRRIGPYPIQKQINPVAFQLTIPASMKVHPVVSYQVYTWCSTELNGGE
jgi:hypothetical protein